MKLSGVNLSMKEIASLYEMVFSLIQEKYNLRPNPYLTDTARHLFTIALGAAPGYAPATNDDALPTDIIQAAFIESYGLKKYIPIIMHPEHFSFEKKRCPVYYSLQHPSTYVFSPKSRSIINTTSEMIELEHIMRIFCKELSSDSNICSDTIISQIAKHVKFDYFHNKKDKQELINLSENIPFLDNRFTLKSKSKAKFASDAPFVRGCIRILQKSAMSD